MMSKKKWMALLLLFLIYLFMGASFFYTVENREEEIRRNQSRQERNEIRDLLTLYYNSSENHTLDDMLMRISEYSGKTMINVSDDEYDTPQKWDFYHSLFFSITVVTTIGYGNIAPTVSVSRIVMIFYAIIGLPMNGILYATLGQYFGRTFIKLYKRWKNNKVKDYAARLGLVSQIILYLIPGFTIFIFIPAIIMMYMEGWVYDLAVYYCFVTLTTIGFGDYVAGFNNQGFGPYFLVYQIFLIIWIIFGLGYGVMVVGFLTGGLRSKKMKKIQKNLTHNFKNTHMKLWNGFMKDFSYLRRIMNELYMAKFKPVYHDEYSSSSTPKIGSQSFPDLRVLYGDASPKAQRRRAYSECLCSRPITRIQSDSDLRRIDKEATFAVSPIAPGELLARVVDALGTIPDESYQEFLTSESEDEGVQGFSDDEILASEKYGSGWSIGGGKLSMVPQRVRRLRATSEVKIPTRVRQDSSVDWTWSGPAASQQIKELRERFKRGKGRVRTMTETSQNGSSQGKNLMERLRNSFNRKIDGKRKSIDVERQESKFMELNNQKRKSIFSIGEEDYLKRTRGGRESVFSVPEARVLEEMTVGDLLRALRSIRSRVDSVTDLDAEPRRKLGTASLTPPEFPSILDIFNPPAQVGARRSSHVPVGSRRSSMIPAATNPATKKRFSLRPVREDQLAIATATATATGDRRSSLRPASGAETPVAMHKQVVRLKSAGQLPMLTRRTRHESLRDIRIDEI